MPTGRAAVFAVALAAGVATGIGLAGRNHQSPAEELRPDLMVAGLSILAAAGYPNRTNSGFFFVPGPLEGRPVRAVGGVAFARDERAWVALILYTRSNGRRVDRSEIANVGGYPSTWSRDASVCDGDLRAEEYEGPLDPRFDKALAILKARC